MYASCTCCEYAAVIVNTACMTVNGKKALTSYLKNVTVVSQYINECSYTALYKENIYSIEQLLHVSLKHLLVHAHSKLYMHECACTMPKTNIYILEELIIRYHKCICACTPTSIYT